MSDHFSGQGHLSRDEFIFKNLLVMGQKVFEPQEYFEALDLFSNKPFFFLFAIFMHVFCATLTRGW